MLVSADQHPGGAARETSQIDASWFEGEGWLAAAVAAAFFLMAVAVLAWLHGPGRRPHDPPVARDRVRWFAGMLAIFGATWLIRGAAGIGWFFVVWGILLVVSLVLLGRARMRRQER